MHDAHSPRPPRREPGAALIGALLTLCLLLVSAPAAALNLEGAGPRAKIDHVDVLDAPVVRLFVTFLDNRSLPVKPEHVDRAIVHCNGQEVDEPIEILALQDRDDAPIDMVVVLPVSQRFPEEVQEQIKENTSKIIGQAREQDRVAVFVDDGRGILSSPLGTAAEASAVISEAAPHAHGAFVYSGLDRAIQTLVRDSDPERKRAIILVTDGFDSTLLTPSEIEARVASLTQRARAAADEQGNGIMIYVVMFKSLFSGIAPPYFEGMARKTRGTYREATLASEIVDEINLTFGEIFGQLVLELRMDVEVGDVCAFDVTLGTAQGLHVQTTPTPEIVFEKVAIDWIFVAVWAVVGLILFIILFILWRRRRRKRQQLGEEQAAISEAERAAQEAEAQIAALEAADEPEQEAAPPKPSLPPPRRVR